MTNKTIIEDVARALCRWVVVNRMDWEEKCEDTINEVVDEDWKLYYGEAKAAIEAISKHLDIESDIKMRLFSFVSDLMASEAEDEPILIAKAATQIKQLIDSSLGQPNE